MVDSYPGRKMFNRLAAEVPAPDSVSVEGAKAATDFMNKVLHMSELTVNRYVKAGSVGRGTNVSELFDLDLLVFTNGFKRQPLRWPEDWHNDDLMVEVRREVSRFVKAAGYMFDLEVKKGSYFGPVLQVQLPNIKVDLLLVPALSHGKDAVLGQHRALMGSVISNPAAAVYDPMRELALSESLTAFVKRLPMEVRNTVRLVKLWYKDGLKATVPGIGSSCLEMCVIAAYQELKEEADWEPDPLTIFEASLRMIIDVGVNKKRAVIDAGEYGYRREQAKEFEHIWGHHDQVILNPADVTCNMAVRPRRDLTKPGPDVAGLVREARALLDVVERNDLEELLDPRASTLGRVLAAYSTKRPSW